MRNAVQVDVMENGHYLTKDMFLSRYIHTRMRPTELLFKNREELTELVRSWDLDDIGESLSKEVAAEGYNYDKLLGIDVVFESVV